MILSVDVDARGLRSLARIGGRIDKDTKAIIRRTVQEARRDLVASINKQGSGAVYQQGAQRSGYRLGRGVVSGRVRALRVRLKTRGAAHQASAPGRPPARLTGTLVRSIRARAARSRRGDFVFVVFADPRTAFYRHFLEFGTRGLLHRQRIAPRPFINPVQRRYVEILEQRISAAIDTALKDRPA